MTLEPYQDDAADWLSKRRRGMIVSPAGSGKTLIAAAALARVLTCRKRDRRVKVGWLANTREQVDQGRKALASFEAIRRLADCKIECAAAATDWQDRDLLVVDEAHHSTSEIWFNQIGTCAGAIWGMTATPDIGDEQRDFDLLKLFHQNVFKIDRAEVSARLAKAKVIILDASDDVRDLIDRETEKGMYRLMRSMPEGEARRISSWHAVTQYGISANEKRNEAAIAAAQRHLDRHVLLLVNHTDHGEYLAQRVGPKARLCHSKMGKKKREWALQSFRDGNTRCLVATSLCDEGIDLPMADVLVLVSGGRSKVKATQRTGRVLRAFQGKSEGLVYDFLDSAHPLMRKHSQARIDLYRSLGYSVTGAGLLSI